MQERHGKATPSVGGFAPPAELARVSQALLADALRRA
jgi:hypothetical protein